MEAANSERVNTRVQELYGNLTEFYKQSGLAGIVQSTNGAQYMNMAEKEMRGLTPEDCSEAAAVLAQMAFNVQKEYNFHSSLAGRIRAAINRMISKEVARMVGSSYEERRQKAITGDDVTSQLDFKAAEHQMKADSLGFLAKHIESVANKFTELGKTKRGSRYDH
jgi:hypothetical protein